MIGPFSLPGFAGTVPQERAVVAASPAATASVRNNDACRLASISHLVSQMVAESEQLGGVIGGRSSSPTDCVYLTIPPTVYTETRELRVGIHRHCAWDGVGP